MPSSRNSEEHEGVWAVDPNTPVVDPMLEAHSYNIHCVTDRCHAFAKMKIRTKICVLYVYNINYHNNLF